MRELQALKGDMCKPAGNCSRCIQMEDLIQVEEEQLDCSSRAWEMVGRSFAVIEWGKRQVVNSVTDLKRSWVVVVGQVDAIQRNAPVESDSPPMRLPNGESSLIHWSDRIAVADGKKQYAVEMNREGILCNSPCTISLRGLKGFSVSV